MGNRISSELVGSTTTISTTAAVIPTTAQTNRRTMLVYNNGSETVYLGGSTVTATTGYPLEPGQEKGFDIDAGLSLYGITSANSSDIRTLEGA